MTCDPWVLDSSSIIEIKGAVAKDKQWGVLRHMEQLVAGGSIAIPREVSREVKNYAHPDVPGVWVSGVEGHLVHPRDPDEGVLRQVLTVAADVVDPDKDTDGDPYVLALARCLIDDGHLATVVSEDVRDRPTKCSIMTACGRLGIPHIRLDAFLVACGAPL